MKQLHVFIIALLLANLCIGQTSVTEIMVPQYTQGTGNLNIIEERRVPFVCRLKLNGLQPGKTYRYNGRFASPAHTGTLTGEGAFFIIKTNGDFTRQATTNMSTAGRYGEFTTDANGSYTGWFGGDVGTGSIFKPGLTVHFKVVVNDGNNGIIPRIAFTTSGITVLGFAETSEVRDGTAIRSTPLTGAAAKNFVFVWDNPDGTGRPLAGCFVESDGTDNSLANGYAPFYTNDVNGVDKAWGNIIPNILSAGIRRMGQYSLTDGSETGYKISSDGRWPSLNGTRANTVNPAGGLTNIVVLDGANLRLDGADLKSGQVITFNQVADKTYGDADFDAGAVTASGVPITYVSNNTNVITVVNGLLHITGAGTAEITASAGGDDFFIPALSVKQTINVRKKDLTIQANDQAKVQGDPIPSLTLSYSGFVYGQDAAVLNPAPVVSTTAAHDSPPNTYPITVGGAGSPNYEITYVPGTLTVTGSKQTQTISFAALPAVVYGTADLSPGATVTSGLTVQYYSNNTGVATIVNNKIHITGAGTAEITASQAGNYAYEAAADVKHMISVAPAALSVTADNKKRLVGQPNPNLTITCTGFVYNETEAVFTSPAVVSTTADVASPANDYPIAVGGAVAANYTISFVPGTLTVEPLPAQTITFNTFPVKKYGDAAFVAGATASSGLTVTYTSSDPSVATIAGDIINIHRAGATIITASQVGDATHAPANPVERTLTVQKPRLTIVANSIEKQEGAINPALTVRYGGFVNGENETALAQAPVIHSSVTTSSLPGVYPITVSGAVSSNYNIVQVDGSFTVLPGGVDAENAVNVWLSAAGKLRVNFYADTAERVTLQLFNSSGSRILENKLIVAKGMNTWYFDVNKLPAGIYPVQIIGSARRVKTKVFIR